MTSIKQRFNAFPPIRKGAAGFLEVLNSATGKLGFDLEFSPTTGRPTILGIASETLAFAGPWSDAQCKDVLLSPHKLVAYSGLGADKPVVEKRLGITTPLSRWIDSMLKHYLCNANMAGGGSLEEGADDSTALGLMNLWTAASLATDLPNWKRCSNGATWNNRDFPDCGNICPVHNEEEYCAIDAWAGLIVDNFYDKEMERKNIPQALYERRAKLAVYCQQMQDRGVRVDMALVAEMEEKIKDKKFGLFPYEVKHKLGKKGQELKATEKIFKDFNPNASKAVCDYFAAAGIELRGKNGKQSKNGTVVRKALEKQLKRAGIRYDVDKTSGELFLVDVDDDHEFPEVLDNLYKLDQNGRAGKGLKSWFDTRYVSPDSTIHARFIATATSTLRLSSASPNLTNLPSRGFGALVKRVIIPDNKDCCVVKADYSSLEFVVILWYAGWDKPISKTVFEDLAAASGGLFDDAAKAGATTSRQIAKSVTHAGNYLESLMLISGTELESPQRRKQIEMGALHVYDGKHGLPKWMFRGKYVCFSGGNLAERLFGDKSYASRAKALGIQSIYFKEYPCIRNFQRKVSEKIENHDYIQTYSGHYLELQDSNENILKLAIALHGQGSGAEYAQEGLLNFQAAGHVMAMHVHDEDTFLDIPLTWSDKKCYDFMVDHMCQPSKIFPGLTCPVKVQRGPNYKDTVEIKGQ